MSPIEKEARNQKLTDEGFKWNKEKSLLEFTVIFPDAKPTFQSQKMVSKQRTRISNMAVFLKNSPNSEYMSTVTDHSMLSSTQMSFCSRG